MHSPVVSGRLRGGGEGGAWVGLGAKGEEGIGG